MTQNPHKRSRRQSGAKIAAGMALCTLIALSVAGAPAVAGDRDHRDDHRDRDRHHDDRGRGYYPPPPVVYGGPYYAPPPVVYGPAIGISLPGINIGIH
jgi:hypothetical protein